MQVHFVIHEAFEAPGAYAQWADSRGHTSSFTRLHAGDQLPRGADAHDMLVVMGGPQSPATTLDECPHFNAVAETSLIAAFAAAGKPVVGVCLGAQLIGEALGASFEHSPDKEIGTFPITLTAAGRANPKFAHFGETLDVGHWHNDMPGLTADATVIAQSEGCPRQIVQYSPLVYGFQCHMEFNREVVALLIAASTQELDAFRSSRFVQQSAELLAQDYAAMNKVLFTFLDKLLAAFEGSGGPRPASAADA
ncbi:hypothetical protein [Stenotrophomonas sp.]|uniref:glutamine amidotransferase-related protein n=1 Tax=Stenotrophomonas sp. TaxID=69392 RepID=UPI00289965DE|nr:hypothetical protein [Stenotrophomonas sp.]